MAARLLALSGAVAARAPVSQRSRPVQHQVDIRKCRALRIALLRAAAVPAVLAVVCGGVILSRNEQANPQIAAAKASLTAVAAQVSAPRVISLLRDAAKKGLSFDEDYNPNQAAITWARRIPEEDARQSVAAVTSGTAPPILQFGPVRIKREIVETVVRAARETDMDPALLMSIADKESSFAPTVKASTSSATGLFQFIDSTWLRVVRDFGAQHGLAREAALIEGDDGERPYISDAGARNRILNLRNDPYLSALLAAEMLKRDAAKIANRIGRDLTEGETYLAHFLGPSDAEKFMAKVVEQPKYAAPKLLPKPARANRSIFFAAAHRKSRSLSVADVHRKFESMMGMRAERYKDVESTISAYAD